MLRFLVQRWSYEGKNKEGVVPVSETGKVETAVGKGEDLGQLVEALKEAVMELRETVTELTNPLNRLSYSGEGEGEKDNYRAKVEAIPLSKPSEGKGKEDTIPSSTIHESVPEAPISEQRTVLPEGENNLERLMNYTSLGTRRQALSTESKLRRIMRLMRVVFNLRGRIPPELLERYVDIFVGLRLISKDDADLVKSVLKAINEGYASGLGPEEQILLMTLLAKGLGINDEALEEEALRVIAESLMRRTPVRGGDGPRTHSGEAPTNKAG